MSAELDFYRSRLKINRHGLDVALEHHAQFLEEIGRECARVHREVETARSHRDMALAALVRRLKATEPKATAPLIDAEATLDPIVAGANFKLRDKQQEHAEWEALNRAWYQRGFDLKALGELYGAQYFAIDSVSAPLPSQQQRQAMREASAAVSQFTRIGRQDEVGSTGIRRRRVT